MQYRWLGRTGIQVSRLCFGTMFLDQNIPLIGLRIKPESLMSNGNQILYRR